MDGLLPMATPPQLRPNNSLEYNAIGSAWFGLFEFQEIKDLYPLSENNNSFTDSFMKQNSDHDMFCPNRELARYLHKSGIKAYRFEYSILNKCFDSSVEYGLIVPNNDTYTRSWASHGADGWVPYFSYPIELHDCNLT